MKRKQSSQDAVNRARHFIDSVARINRRHGMGSSIPKERYERAVADAAKVYKNIRGRI